MIVSSEKKLVRLRKQKLAVRTERCARGGVLLGAFDLLNKSGQEKRGDNEESKSSTRQPQGKDTCFVRKVGSLPLLALPISSTRLLLILDTVTSLKESFMP